MVTVLLLLLCCGPLLVAASALLLFGLSANESFGGASGTVSVVIMLLTLQLLAAAAVGVVYRWCFLRPAVRGAGLVAALLVSTFALSDPNIIRVFQALYTKNRTVSESSTVWLAVFIEGATVIGIALSACMVAILIVEVPLRWVQGGREIVSDGAFRMLRVVGVLVLAVACSSFFRERGLSQLIELLKRAVA